MEIQKNNPIGIKGFYKLFDLPNDVKNKIENFKNKKTIILFDFESFSKDKKKYKKLKFPFLNKEFPIHEKNPIDF